MQITLRTVHELFEADRTGLDVTVVFNGRRGHLRPAHRASRLAMPGHPAT
jgi:hypothetical protein